MTNAPGPVVFDAYGTLFDPVALSEPLERRFPGRGLAFALAWRATQLRHTWLRSLMERWADFDTITGDTLAQTLDAAGLPADDSLLADLLAAYRSLPPYPDVAPALAALAPERHARNGGGDGPGGRAGGGAAGRPVRGGSPCLQTGPRRVRPRERPLRCEAGGHDVRERQRVGLRRGGVVRLPCRPHPAQPRGAGASGLVVDRHDRRPARTRGTIPAMSGRLFGRPDGGRAGSCGPAEAPTCASRPWLRWCLIP